MAKIIPPEDEAQVAKQMYKEAREKSEELGRKLDEASHRHREEQALFKACQSLKPCFRKSDPMTAWLLSERRLTFWERCKVGWQLWADGVGKYPWPVSQSRPEDYFHGP